MTGRKRIRTVTVHPKQGKPISINIEGGIHEMVTQLECGNVVRDHLCSKHGWQRDDVRVSFHGKWEE